MWFKLTNKYTAEITGFRKQHYFGDDGEVLAKCEIPIMNISVDLVYGKEKDHSPAIYVYWEVWGYVIIDLMIYNNGHAQ